MKIQQCYNSNNMYNETFIGRDNQIKEFWNYYYNLCERKEDWTVSVLNYFGPGGIGKTCLLNHLYREVKSANAETKERIPTALIQLNSSERVVDTLFSLVIQLSCEYDFSFPMFQAVLGMGLKKNMHMDTKYKSLEEKFPILSAVLDVSGGFSETILYGIVARCVDKGIKQIVDYVSSNRIKLEKWTSYSVVELEQLLPDIFAQDFNMNVAQRIYPTVIFMDKYENLRVGITGVDVADFQIGWLKEKLICQIPNVIWVFSGRERIDWVTDNLDWKESVHNIPVDFFDIKCVEQYFEDLKLDKMHIKEILEITQGLPLYLYLCKEIILSQKQRGLIQLGFLKDKQEKLLRTYVENLSDMQKQILFVLSCLGEWDDEMIALVLPSMGMENYSNEYSILMRKSYTNQKSERYVLHQVIQEKVFQFCSEQIAMRVGNSLSIIVEKNNITWKYPALVRCLVKSCKSAEEFRNVLNSELKMIVDSASNGNINFYEKCYKEINIALFDGLKLSIQYTALKYAHVRNMVQLGYLEHAKQEVNAMIRTCKKVRELQSFIFMGLELKAQILDNQKKYLQAYNNRKKSLDLSLEIPDEHVYIACLHNLIVSNIHLHNFEQAQQGAEYVLAYRKNHLSTSSEKEDYIRACSLQINILMEIYKTQFDQKSLLQACELQEELVEISNKLLGFYHYLTAEIIHELAEIYIHLRNWEQVIVYCSQAKEIFIHLNGGRNTITDNIDRNIAVAYLELGNINKSNEIFTDLERVSVDYIEGGEVVKYRNTLERCIILSREKKYEESYKILSDIIPQCIKELGENHLTSIRLQYEQAIECYNMGRFEDALSLLTIVKRKLRYHDEVRHEALVDLLILDCRKGLANS